MKTKTKMKAGKVTGKPTARQDVKKAVALTKSKKFAPLTAKVTSKVYPKKKLTRVVDTGFTG